MQKVTSSMTAASGGSGLSYKVIGPSHAVRWNWHVRDGVVRCDLPSEAILGLGGAPIWSMRLFEAARRHVAKGRTVGVMVGDFRFGNAIALAPEQEAGALFHDGFRAITARGETPRHPLARGTEPQAETVITPDLAAHMVEQGPLGIPSWTGLVHLLEQIESGALSASRADPEGGVPPPSRRSKGMPC